MSKILFVLGVSFIAFSCNSFCAGSKVSIGLASADAGDQVNLYIVGKLVAHRDDIRKRFISPSGDKRNYLTEVCVNEDSILVKPVFNSIIDTSFYLNPKEVEECFFGKDVTNHILVFNKYVDGGYRSYDPRR